MFVEPDTFNLHDFAKENDITKLETELDQLADETDKEPTTEELEAEYKKVAPVLRGKRLHLLRVSQTEKEKPQVNKNT